MNFAANILPSEFKVRLGKHIRKRKEASEQSSDEETVTVRPRYDSDVALIQLRDDIVYTDSVQPICLPSSASDFDLLYHNITASITGWGAARRPGARRHAYRKLKYLLFRVRFPREPTRNTSLRGTRSAQAARMAHGMPVRGIVGGHFPLRTHKRTAPC